jgi:spermidine/putrescine transport system ATP-binding protein
MSDRIAVMHDGRVMQCGVPEDVYKRPEEPFVAGFIGISNLIEGTVTGEGTVELPSGVSVPAPPPADCRSGERVRIAVRPEKIAIDHIEPGMVRLEGVVEQRVYLGMTTQITVALGGDARLVALEQNTYRARAEDRCEEGHRLTLGWRPEHCLILR